MKYFGDGIKLYFSWYLPRGETACNVVVAFHWPQMLGEVYQQRSCSVQRADLSSVLV